MEVRHEGRRFMTDQAERAPTTPEQKRFHPKRWLATAMACAALTACSDSVNNSFPKAPTTAETTAGPDDGEETASTEKPQIIPDEAKDWVAEYGDRYVDPVSTFYAELGYEAKYGTFAYMTSKDIDEYEITYETHGETSPLGFTMETLPLDAKIEQEDSIKIFNSWIAPNLDLYMNLIAKNPTPKGIAIVEEQFRAYCEGENPNSVNGIPNEESSIGARKILDTMAAIVTNYGSNAVYSIAPATTWENREQRETSTVFYNPTIVYENDSGFTDAGIQLLINIDAYNGKEVSRKTETIEDFQIIVYRQPTTGTDTFSYLSFGES